MLKHAIIGADFIHHFNLIIDLSHNRILDPSTNLSTLGTPHFFNNSLSTIATQCKYYDLIKQFPTMTHFSNSTNNIKHNTCHIIQTHGQPVYTETRRLSPEKLQIAKQEFQFLLDYGICRPSNSPWASPLHLVQKKSGHWRPVDDYRRLNSVTLEDRYPVPNQQDFSATLEERTVFSTLDLVRAYHQIPIEESSIPKTAIITPFGLFEFTRMQFGLRNAAQTFQRFIHEVLHDLNFCFPYLDDILIASNTSEQHEASKQVFLKQVFARLEKFGLTINLDKCIFGEKQVRFFGHLVSSQGSSPLPEKVEAITNYLLPKYAGELRRFLGMLNFYRRFIPNAAQQQAILHEMHKNCKKNDKTPLHWTKQMLDACNQSKTNAALLVHPSSLAPIALTVDASDFGMGAVVEQLQGSTWKPLSFFSKKFSPAQKRYSTYDRELLAIYAAIKYFQYLLEGRSFEIFTDHKSLIFAFKQKADKSSPRQIRHLSFIAQFSTNITHISGKHNIVADALSRLEAIQSSSRY